jgi:transposase
MKNTKQKHQVYTNSFKLMAVRLAEQSTIQNKEVALALDIHPFMLSRWKKEAREGLLTGVVAKQALVEMEAKMAEQKQIRRLEKCLKRLELENALLKKSIQFSSKHAPTSSDL